VSSHNHNTSDVLFTQWLHSKFSNPRTPEALAADFLVNMIVNNDLDVDISNLGEMYEDVLSYLRLNSSDGRLVNFFTKVWKEYQEEIIL